MSTYFVVAYNAQKKYFSYIYLDTLTRYSNI
jgi:hypothetical protein